MPNNPMMARALGMLAAVLLALGAALSPAGAQQVSRSAKGAEFPLDSSKYFSPDHPLSDLLDIRLTAKKTELPFGEEPEFSVSIKNIGPHPVHLGGDLVEAAQFNPFMIVGVVSEDGREWSFRHDWMVPEPYRLLEPGKTLRFSYPLAKAKPDNDKYRLRPDAYIPGTYYAFVNFWVLKDGINRRALSPAAKFTVKDDGKADSKIAREIQLGTSLPKGFEFELQKVGEDQVRVYAVNRSKEDVYIGNNWGWWRKYPGKVSTEQRSGKRPTQRIIIPAGTKKALQTTAIGSGDIKGTYQIRFKYYNGAGRMLAESDILKAKL